MSESEQGCESESLVTSTQICKTGGAVFAGPGSLIWAPGAQAVELAVSASLEQETDHSHQPAESSSPGFRPLLLVSWFAGPCSLRLDSSATAQGKPSSQDFSVQAEPVSAANSGQTEPWSLIAVLVHKDCTWPVAVVSGHFTPSIHWPATKETLHLQKG